jgi:ketosteroid isomerase-like protein
MLALVLLAVAAAHSPGAAQAEHQIRARRAAFNRAIAKGDIPAIAAVLADNAQLVTGSDSSVISGKAAQVAVWSRDLKDKSRGIYVRTPDRITVSPFSMALETGHWRGRDNRSARIWAKGEYVAKWRRFGGTWKIESETYMTTACGGSYCPKRR